MTVNNKNGEKQQNSSRLESFGARLRFLRKKHGLSQADFAEKLQYKGSASISKIETNSSPPDFYSLITISETLNADLHWLITGQPAPSAQELTTERNDLMNKLSSYVISELKRLTDQRDSLLEQRRKLGDETPENGEALARMAIHIYEVQQQLDAKMRDLQWVQPATPSAESTQNSKETT